MVTIIAVTGCILTFICGFIAGFSAGGKHERLGMDDISYF